MSFTSFYVPSLKDESKWHDIRITIPGNSETWYRNQPLKNFKGIIIHHTAGPTNQTPESIALYHTQVRGWGGIGYHFLIDFKGNVYYVGDISTQRAHVANLNHLYYGISLIGDFTTEQPTKQQLRSAHLLCKEIIDFDNRFDINWDSVKQHKQLQATACPGNTVDKWWNEIFESQSDHEQELKEKLENLEQNLVEANKKISGLNSKIKELEKYDCEKEISQALKNQAEKHKIELDELQEKITGLENSKEYKIAKLIVKVFNKMKILNLKST